MNLRMAIAKSVFIGTSNIKILSQGRTPGDHSVHLALLLAIPIDGGSTIHCDIAVQRVRSLLSRCDGKGGEKGADKFW